MMMRRMKNQRAVTSRYQNRDSPNLNKNLIAHHCIQKPNNLPNHSLNHFPNNLPHSHSHLNPSQIKPLFSNMSSDLINSHLYP